MSIETIRYSLIGKEDIKLDPRNGTFTVTLANGQVFQFHALDIAYLISDAYLEASLPTNAVTGQVARATDQDVLFQKRSDRWIPVATPPAYAFASLPSTATAGVLARVTDTLRGLWMGQGSHYFALNGRTVDVREFGAKGDDSTDDLAAFQAAFTALGTTGGTLYVPRGTYKVSSRLQPTSNIWIRGAGMGATILKNTDPGVAPGDIAIDIRGVLGTNYAINTPTEGAATVTTTTAANAGNFSNADVVAVSGPLSSGDYVPFLITTVVSADSGTGIVTLNERLPRQDLTLIHKITTLPQNIGVSDLTLHTAIDIGLYAKYARNIHVERVQIVEGVLTSGVAMAGVRNAVVTEVVRAGGTGGLDFHSCVGVRATNASISKISGAGVTFEGGCESCSLSESIVTDPLSTAVQINTQSQRITVTSNELRHIPSSSLGVIIGGAALGHGDNVVAFNHITLASGATGAIGISLGDTSHDNIIALNRIIGAFSAGVQNGSGSNLRNVVVGNHVVGATDDHAVVTGSTFAPTLQPAHIYPTYGANVTIDPRLGDIFTILVTNSNNFTIDNPAGTAANNIDSNVITINVQNTSGGAMGTITWGSGSGYKMATWTNPANGFTRSITFQHNRTAFGWKEISRTTADVPN